MEPTHEQRRFALVAGEPSGDLLAGLLLDGLKERWPEKKKKKGGI